MRSPVEYDVIVVGAGHAGCEAALAAARMGCRTLLTTISLDTIAQMSCNPAVGGTAKGIVVREVDALGGAQGLLTDRAGIQFRMLNRSRGPAVQSPRAQCDKRLYSALMKQLLEQTPNLTLRQEMVEELFVDPAMGRGARMPAPGTRNPEPGTRVIGVRGSSGLTYAARAVVLTTGTFLRGLIHQGSQQYHGGRAGEVAAMNLSVSLEALGFELRRLKTGTPPRLNGRTINFAGLEKQWGDEPPPAFSFRTAAIERPRLCCYLSHTTPRTHEIIRANLDRAPLFTGQITSRGPRYCPSVEDKVVRFADRDSHQIFLEPEGAETAEFYVNGLSTSLPPDVQLEMVHSVPGCEDAEVLRFGYAIEYDMVPPHQLQQTLETRRVAGLFLAGQINGTSGYEEAAGQGIVAGINAALSAQTGGREALILGRDEAYIGIMIDDLVTKDISEPYRLFTSRSEYRLLLRQDNADRRLAAHARRLGLLESPILDAMARKHAAIEAGGAYLRAHRPPGSGKTYWDLLRQPGVAIADCGLRIADWLPESSGVRVSEISEAIEIEAKYEGYLKRQTEQIERLKELELRALPEGIDYPGVKGLGREATEKLSKHRPRTFGQALRLAGVTPADLSLLAIHLTQQGHRLTEEAPQA